MNNYRTQLHGRCPINRGWDYYTLLVTSSEFIKCEDIKACCDIVRGGTMTQEEIAGHLRKSMPAHCSFTITGTHANVETVVSL